MGSWNTKGLGLSDECIHGLDNGLCAVCFPKAAPEVAAVASSGSPRAGRARSAARATPRRTALLAAARSSRGPTKHAVDDVGEQRIYHVTHIRNLSDILTTGSLLADASDAWGTRPTVDISSVRNREARRIAPVAGEGGRSVASFVPFFLSPNASVWESIRSRADDPRLALGAHGSAASDFVILVSTVKKVIDAHAGDKELRPASAVVADGDAAAEPTRFGAAPEASERMLRKLRADQDSEAILEAEFLVREAFPFELVTLVGVANDRVRDSVKDILKSSAYLSKVAVYPPWFQPGGASAL